MSDYEDIIRADADEGLVGISTGLPNLDMAIGAVRGFPIGRVTLLTGRYSTGKTSLALFALAQAQKAGMDCVYVDTEMAFDKEHARMCGVDLSKLNLLRQKEHAEKVFDTIELYLAGRESINAKDRIKPHKNVFMILDSYSGLSIRDEVEGDASTNDYAGKTKKLARFFRKIKTPIYLHNSLLVIMGHEYKAMTQPTYMILAGGDSMEKTPSLWIDLKKKPGFYVKKGDKRVGEVITATIKKNKIGGIKYAEADLQFVFGKGWNPVADILADALDRKIITREGNTFFFNDEKIGTKSKLDDWAKNNEELLKGRLKDHEEEVKARL